MIVSAAELLKSGETHAALDRLKQEVRKAPREPRLRTFLFQMFCIVGAWDRALTQLAAAAELDPAALPMAQAYRAAIRCEMLRERVFAGSRTPTVLGTPEPWMSLLIEANRRLAAGAPEDAAQLRDAAFEQAPSVAGTLDGQSFDWIADADPRLGPMLEAIVDGKYYWVPFLQIRSVDIEAPADLRDQVWMPAHFIWTNGGEAYGFIPTRNPGSAAAEDPALALSRKTEWRAQGDWYLGLGQRVLATDTAEIALMDARRLDLTEHAADAA